MVSLHLSVYKSNKRAPERIGSLGSLPSNRKCAPTGSNKRQSQHFGISSSTIMSAEPRGAAANFTSLWLARFSQRCEPSNRAIKPPPFACGEAFPQPKVVASCPRLAQHQRRVYRGNKTAP